MSKRRLVFRQVVSVIAIVNFVCFVGAAFYLGGDALNGRAFDGHYFLGYKGHYSEVSHSVFEYSTWHARSVIFTICLALAVSAALRDNSKNS